MNGTKQRLKWIEKKRKLKSDKQKLRRRREREKLQIRQNITSTLISKLLHKIFLANIARMIVV